MRVIVSGACGRMGLAVLRQMRDCAEPMHLAAAVDPRGGGGCLGHIENFTDDADAIIDFSNREALPALLRYAAHRRIPLVCGTTGLFDDDRAALRRHGAKTPIFYSENFSVGIAFLQKALVLAGKALGPCESEIVELHHRAKADLPSATALLLENTLRGFSAPAVHSLRCGDAAGDHAVYLCMPSESITLLHQAADRAVFARGALRAAVFLQHKKPGLYTMEDLLQ